MLKPVVYSFKTITTKEYYHFRSIFGVIVIEWEKKWEEEGRRDHLGIIHTTYAIPKMDQSIILSLLILISITLDKVGYIQ